jgi:hypothetical protein
MKFEEIKNKTKDAVNYPAQPLESDAAKPRGHRGPGGSAAVSLAVHRYSTDQGEKRMTPPRKNGGFVQSIVN